MNKKDIIVCVKNGCVIEVRDAPKNQRVILYDYDAKESGIKWRIVLKNKEA